MSVTFNSLMHRAVLIVVCVGTLHNPQNIWWVSIYLCVICFSLAYKNVSECWDCTAGFHCSQPGQDAPVGPCDPGYYCPRGASSPQEVPCGPGTYCVGQNEEPELCPIGTFQPNNTRTSISDCLNCTAGMFLNGETMVCIFHSVSYPSLDCLTNLEYTSSFKRLLVQHETEFGSTY